MLLGRRRSSLALALPFFLFFLFPCPARSSFPRSILPLTHWATPHPLAIPQTLESSSSSGSARLLLGRCRSSLALALPFFLSFLFPFPAASSSPWSILPLTHWAPPHPLGHPAGPRSLFVIWECPLAAGTPPLSSRSRASFLLVLPLSVPRPILFS